MYVFGTCELDLARYELRRGGGVIHVQPQVFGVLRHLLEHRDRVVPKTELLDAVWGDRFVSDSTLSSRIKAARQAVGDDGASQRLIATIHGVGYRFIGDAAGPPPDSEPPPGPAAAPERDQEIRYCRSPAGVRIAYATTGSELLSIVPAEGLWVEANFKESQLARMRPGEPVIIKADVLPGVEFKGRVESLAPATGAEFSLLPLENATGNFTKIVQRVPVRIRLEGAASRLGRLRPGPHDARQPGRVLAGQQHAVAGFGGTVAQMGEPAVVDRIAHRRACKREHPPGIGLVGMRRRRGQELDIQVRVHPT